MKIEYHLPYTRRIWDYNKAETDSINRSIENVDCRDFFLRKKVHEQVEIFNQTMLNIFHNFIPNKTTLCEDRAPPWMNEKIKSLVKKKNAFYCSQRKSINFDYTTLDVTTLEVSNSISI